MTETGPFPQKFLPDGSPDNYLASLLAEWLRFYGPVPVDFIRQVFGISQESLDEALAGLLEDRVIVFDQLIRGETGFQVCDTENLEALLRLQRREEVPSFKALPADNLRLFLASVQGLTEPGKLPEDLQNVLERLFGYPARAETWETEIFPARLPDYNGSWLDNLLRRSELEWFGLRRERLSFCFTSDYELFRENGGAEPEPKDTRELLPDRRGKFSFWDLLEHTGGSSSDLSKDLWKEVWGGNISCDSFTAVRRGILNRFRAHEAERAAEIGRSSRGTSRRGLRRRGFNRWKADRLFYGNWYFLEPGPDEPDALEEEEIKKDRVRQLLRRYGILFRELLANELPILKWAGVFRSLRIMELSGEILSGHFFQGIPGLQFISPAGFRFLKKGLSKNAVYWICAVDPASLCGIELKSHSAGLPPRLPSNHIVFHGAGVVLVSRRRGKDLEFLVPPEHESIPEYLKLFTVHMDRDYNPWKLVRTETINNEPAPESPYKEALIKFGFQEDYKSLVLRARF